MKEALATQLIVMTEAEFIELSIQVKAAATIRRCLRQMTPQEISDEIDVPLENFDALMMGALPLTVLHVANIQTMYEGYLESYGDLDYAHDFPTDDDDYAEGDEDDADRGVGEVNIIDDSNPEQDYGEHAGYPMTQGLHGTEYGDGMPFPLGPPNREQAKLFDDDLENRGREARNGGSERNLGKTERYGYQPNGSHSYRGHGHSTTGSNNGLDPEMEKIMAETYKKHQERLKQEQLDGLANQQTLGTTRPDGPIDSFDGA